MNSYEELTSLEDCDDVTNFGETKCTLCSRTLLPKLRVLLQGCLHAFCRFCISDMIVTTEVAEVKCPFRDANYICDSILRQEEIKALVEPEIYEEYLRKFIASDVTHLDPGEKIIRCKTDNCSSLCIGEDSEQECLRRDCKGKEAERTSQSSINVEIQEKEQMHKNAVDNVQEDFSYFIARLYEEKKESVEDERLKDVEVVRARATLIETENVANNFFELDIQTNFPQCSCCFETYTLDEIVYIESCLHPFCRDCLVDAISTSSELQIKCPYALQKCEAVIQEHEVKALVDAEVYEQYLSRTIAQLKVNEDEKVLHCKAVNCPAWYILEDHARSFECRMCKTKNFIASNEEEEGSDECSVKTARYEELMTLQECEFVPNFEPFECPVCFDSYEAGKGVVLRDCLHTICRSCIADMVLYSEEAVIKCPYKDADFSCDVMLRHSEIKALVEPYVYQQYLTRSIKEAESSAGTAAFHCKTVDCSGWCFYDKDVSTFHCPVCDVENCLMCQDIHTGKTCERYEDEKRLTLENVQTSATLKSMLDNATAMLCPRCGIVLTKNGGCDWLVCTQCKTEICWVTRGPRWGPNGKGDNSGGCGCSIRRCHPACKNCH